MAAVVTTFPSRHRTRKAGLTLVLPSARNERYAASILGPVLTQRYAPLMRPGEAKRAA